MAQVLAKARRLAAGFAVVALCVLLILSAMNLALWRLDLADCPVFETNPDYGYLAKPEQIVSTRGRKFHINNLGLRGADLTGTVPPGTKRIAFIGDSVTFAGGTVYDRQEFVNVAARLLEDFTGEKFETVNISAPGWGIQNIDGYIRDKGIHGSKLVIWVLPIEDFRRSKTTVTTFGHLPTRKYPFRVCCVLETIRTGFVGSLRSVLLRRRKPTSVDSQRVLTANLEAFRDALSRVVSQGAIVNVVFLPEGDAQPASDPIALASYQHLATLLGATTCDLGPEIARHGGGAVFYDGIHLNPVGHEIVGKLIASCVESSE